MKLTKKIQHLLAGAVLAVLTVSLYAAMQFAPSTQPATILGKYALKNTSLEGGTIAYRPFYENGAWQGDIIQYEIDANGNRLTDASVGSNSPVVAGSSGGCGKTAPDGCWMARATFESKVAGITDYWKEITGGRNIFTYGDTNDDGVADTQVDFLWSNLSAGQRAMLDSATAANPTPLTAAYDSPILNFIRGDDSNEKANGGTYRNRYSLLGDIINSWPVYIGAPTENYTTPSFIAFKNLYSGTNLRDGRIAVGANDGMLHVFDEDDGSEVYAYVPSMLHGKLDRLTVLPYDSVNHTSYVDGKLTSVSAQINGAWKTVLTGGLGAGGKGLFALDVTNPDPSSDKILFEVTGSDVGYIYSQPSVVRLDDGNWYIVTGNGYGVSGAGKLLLISLNNGSYTSISTGVVAGLSGATLVDTNADTYADIAFAGDAKGNMWKFYLGSNPPSPNPKRIYQPPVGIGTDQPITTRPEVGEHPLGGYMVLFGTGSITSLTEAIDDSYPTQALYGIWDSGPGNVVVGQTLAVATQTFTSGSGNSIETVRYVVTNNAIDYNCAANDATCDIGWKVNLPNAGERVVGPPQLRNSRMIVVTTNPLGIGGSSDLVGDSWLMSVNYLTGGDNNTIVLNLNGDSELNSGDAVDIGSVDDPDLRAPVGLHLGDGNLSQPTLASINPGTDAIFINGLRMPLPITKQVKGPLLAGHLDVETDSPSGGSTATNSISKHSEGYNIETHDGLGYGIDGHFHEYDTSNNVTYVDIFQLEPRRGKPSANPVSAPCSSDSNMKTIDITGEGDCLLVLEGELNRAYDTLATDADGFAETSVESEVYALGTTTPMAADQKFIVVVANADLSPAAELQIGCRTWDATKYQDMITYQLEDLGRTPSQLQDSYHGNASLIFTAADIVAGNTDNLTCPDYRPDPTLSITFSNTDILQGGIHGTRAQCVLGLHDYRDPVDYYDPEVLCYAPKHLPGYTETFDCGTLKNPIGDALRDPGASYIKDPALNLHITQIPDAGTTGYRWRNGALTVQLLKVNNSTNAAEYTLQNPDFLPTRNAKRFGGTYAQAFTVVKITGKDTITLTEGANESGLLHETTAYWHLGDLSDGIQRGAPSSVPCYGDPNWNGVWSQETRGLTEGQYAALYDDIDEEVLAAYDAAVLDLRAALAANDEAAINQALLKLGKLLAADDDLAAYDRYRDYAPGVIPEQHLREIDQNLADDPNDPTDDPSVDDGTPAQVDDLTTGSGTSLNRDILGPNFAIGRRTWIDLRQ